MKQLFRNPYLNSIFTKGINVFIGVITSIFINRYLGPELKGEYAYALNIVNIFVLILNFGIYQSYPLQRRKNLNEINNRYFSIIIFQFFVYSILALAIRMFFSNNLIVALVFFVPIMVLNQQLNFIALVENINKRNRIFISTQLVYLFILALLYLFGEQNLYYAYIILLLKEIFSVISIIKRYHFKFELSKVDFKFLLETIKYGIYPMFTALMITLNYNIDVLLLKIFVNFEQIGLYSVGVGLANQVWLIPDAFKDVLFSKTAKSNSIKDIKLSIKINLYFSLFIIVGIFLYGKKVLKIMYGIDFIDAYQVTTIIMIGLVPMIFYKMIISLFNATGKQKVAFVVLLISIVINILLNLILIPIYGISGAAFASVISYSICGGLFINKFLKYFDVKLRELFLIERYEIEYIKNLLRKKK